MYSVNTTIHTKTTEHLNKKYLDLATTRPILPRFHFTLLPQAQNSKSALPHRGLAVPLLCKLSKIMATFLETTPLFMQSDT
jgi:hypothetical protein